jgi:hypothetical protein
MGCSAKAEELSLSPKIRCVLATTIFIVCATEGMQGTAQRVYKSERK